MRTIIIKDYKLRLQQILKQTLIHECIKEIQKCNSSSTASYFYVKLSFFLLFCSFLFLYPSLYTFFFLFLFPVFLSFPPFNSVSFLATVISHYIDYDHDSI